MRIVFNLHIKCDNAAFEGEDRNTEVARILRRAAEELEDGKHLLSFRDINGNSVGFAAFTQEKDTES